MHETEKPLSQFHSVMLPQEEVLDREKRGKQLIIGIIGEEDPHETRIAITPQAVDLLCQNGHKVLIEKNAGLASRFTPRDFAEAGAIIKDKKADVFVADVLLKVSPLTQGEIGMLKGGQTVISSLNLATRDESYFRSMMAKKTTAIAFELLQDGVHEFPVLRSMCEIAGTVSVSLGSRYLSTYDNGKGILFGGITGITPAEVVILGAGTAAEYASRTALGMGAIVKVFDHSIPALRSIKKSIGRELFTSVMHPPVLQKAFETADLVISTLQRLNPESFFLVPEDMIMSMKKGSVVVDMHIDQGSSFETGRLAAQDKPVYREHGVIHYMAPNMTSLVGRTASIALSNVLMPLILNEGRCGGIQQLIMEDFGVRHGVYLFNGILTHEMIGSYYNIPFKDIDLLLSAF